MHIKSIADKMSKVDQGIDHIMNLINSKAIKTNQTSNPKRQPAAAAHSFEAKPPERPQSKQRH